MAVGADDKDTNVPAHSNTTAADGTVNNDVIIVMYFPFLPWFVRHTLRIKSNTTICNDSPQSDTLSTWVKR
ncbi:hypothetical protein HanIR_Chr14g0702011 [Helianthus annuus]|nr:hypothetical protein HanIR_Chr14g0702011 [Helianthus annuus]